MKSMPLAGVIGSPIAHSRSPKIHKHWLKKYSIIGDYVPMLVEEHNLETVLRSLPKAGFVGLNVTLPHKEKALELADTVSNRAKLIGATNTLFFDEEGRINADNTDGYGFVENLRTCISDWTVPKQGTLVLGAGGAARAVISALLSAGATNIILTNRTRDRAEKLAAFFGDRITVLDWSDKGDAMSDCNLLVNTTSLGMNGQPKLEVSLDRLSQSAVVTDLVYSPLRTELLISAKENGCIAVDGLGMLLHQAVPGFQRWFGRKPEVDDTVREAALR